MNTARRRYDDYERSEDLDNVYDDEEEAEEENESFIDIMKRKWKRWFDPDFKEEDEEEEEEDEEPPARQRVRRDTRRTTAEEYADEPARQRTARRETRRTRTEEYADEPEREPVSYDISDADIKRYSEKFGTRPAPMRDERRKKVRERMDPGASERRTTSPRRTTTSAPAWENYRGNVKRIVETAPRTAENIEEIASMLMDDYAVIIDMANIKNSRSSAISYLEGVAFVLNYQFDRIGDDYYICAPEGYMVEHEFGTYSGARRSNGR